MAIIKNFQTDLFGKEDFTSTLPTLLMEDISLFPKPKKLIETCENIYTKNELESLCGHLKKVFSKYNVRNRKDPEKTVGAIEMLYGVQKVKRDFSIPVANIICIKENFAQYISLLDQATQRVWELLYLYLYRTPDQINKQTERKFYHKNTFSYYTRYTANTDALNWFKETRGYYYGAAPNVTIPETLWSLYKESVAVPELQKLIAGQGMFDVLPQEEQLVVYDNEKFIGSQVNLIQKLKDQGQLGFGVNKMSASVIKKANKQIQMQEFFPEENVSMASSLAIPFLADFFGQTTDVSMQYWNLLSNAFVLALFDYIIMDFFSHVKGLRRNDIIYESNYEKIYMVLFEVMADLTLDKWYSFLNVQQRFLVHDGATKDTLTILPLYTIDDGNIHDAGDLRQRLSSADFHDYFLRPLLQGFMSLFASCGLVKIAYHKDGQGRGIGKYSFIEYVQLTKLGAYVFGQADKYEAEGVHMPVEYFSADENYLIILSKEIDGKNPYEGLLTNIAEPIGAHRYRVTSATYLNGCENADDLRQKEKFFKENICAKPSAVWEEFFAQMLNRCDPLNEVSAAYTIKAISPENKELQHLFVTDKYLKRHTLRAENYIVMIETKALQKVKEILRSYGYLIV